MPRTALDAAASLATWIYRPNEIDPRFRDERSESGHAFVIVRLEGEISVVDIPDQQMRGADRSGEVGHHEAGMRCRGPGSALTHGAGRCAR